MAALATLTLPAVPVAARQAPPEPATAAATTPAVGSQTAPVRADLRGLWRSANDAGDPFVQLEFTRSGEDIDPAWKALLTLPAAALKDRPLDDAKVVDGRSFSGSVSVFGVTLRFEGSLVEGGTAINASVEMDRGGQPQKEALRLVPTAHAATIPGATRYTTELEAMGMKLPMGLTLADAGELGWVGVVDVPAQGMTGVPAIVERSPDGALTVTLPVGMRAVMTLQPADEGAVLSGTFAQGPISVPIRFERSDAPLKGSSRPQDPKPPFPYTEEEVVVPTPEGHTLAGTLTLPGFARADRRVPGVVLLTGSGLQDRDESLMGHRPFLVLADALARGGMAVLRCDDRGFGKSTGDGTIATTHDFASDGRAMMAFLRSRPEVDPAYCGYIGHSEGGLTGPMAALADQKEGSPVAFVVTLAGTAVPGAEILTVQTRRLFEAQGVPRDEAEAIARLNQAAMRAVLDGKPVEEQRTLIADLIRLQQAAVARRAGMEPPQLEVDSPEVSAALAALQAPWMRTFIELDPAPVLRELKAPVFALNGDLDTQVDTEQNLLRIEQIRREAGLPVTIRRYPNLNHLFQPAVTGGIEEYATIETTIDPVVLDDLVRWIKETTARPAARPTASP